MSIIIIKNISLLILKFIMMINLNMMLWIQKIEWKIIECRDIYNKNNDANKVSKITCIVVLNIVN